MLSPLLAAAALFKFVRTHIEHWRMKRSHAETLDSKLRAAIKTTADFDFAAALISAKDFESLGELRPHEELRDRGVLVFHDHLEELISAPQHTIFFSHQVRPLYRPRPTPRSHPGVAPLPHALSPPPASPPSSSR